MKSLEQAGKLLERRTTAQSVRVHERCDTPVEYVVTTQWFVRALDFKAQLLEAGERITWRPAHMGTRYREWVENLRWDWCISRQRYFGVPFPVWYCDSCGATILANEDELPLDPTERQPTTPCECGGTSFTPERDVMDTWATSSLSPQIVGQYFDDPGAVSAGVSRSRCDHRRMRSSAPGRSIRSSSRYHHFGALPWTNVAISGWGLAGEGMGKISKSRGGGRAHGAAGDDREVFRRRGALLGGEHRLRQRFDHQRGEDRDRREAGDEAVERGEVRRALSGR